MIENDHQLKITRDRRRKFARARSEHARSVRPHNVHPILWEAEYQALAGIITELDEEIAEYERKNSRSNDDRTRAADRKA